MAATAGYLATVSVTGNSTTMTNEATSGGGANYQITSADRQIVDPSAAITVKVGGVAQATSTFTFDYLTGSITLSAPTASSVTFDGKFLPKRQIAQAYEVDVSLSRMLQDSSLLGTEHTLRTPTLADITGTFSCYDSGLNVYTDVDLAQILADGTAKVIDMNWNGTQFLRFFAMLESVEASASVDGVQTASVGFSMAGQTALTTGVEIDFSIL